MNDKINKYKYHVYYTEIKINIIYYYIRETAREGEKTLKAGALQKMGRSPHAETKRKLPI